MNTPNIAFEGKRLNVPIDRILPVRQIKEPEKRVRRFPTILASIPEVGLIEPLMVYPQKDNPGYYLLMDGHLRLEACRKLGWKRIGCLVARDDESYTYNAKISRVAPIQERKMILKAVESGVPVERIAGALNLDIAEVKARLKLTDGLAPEVVELLKDKQMSPVSLKLLKRVLFVRQIEIAELMVTTNTYTRVYLEALLLGTPKDKFVTPAGKGRRKMKPEEVARVELEMESLEREYKTCEQGFSESVLQLTVFRRYVMKLLDHGRVNRFISTRFPEIYEELTAIVASETVC